MTLYRAGGDSPIIRSLIRAAERGVQVAVLVELKARFDEATNVSWAKQLERAGVHVVYGMVGLKTHSKCVLVVRDDGDQLRRYCHIGTGNYNTKTARLYEDLGILTCDHDIGADVAKLFNHLTGYSRDDDYHTLLVAPRDLRPQLLELIEHETALRRRGPHHDQGQLDRRRRDDRGAVRGQPGRRADRPASSAASAACAPACPGCRENIRVRSILGRYLEHSRIYRFAHGDVDDRPLLPHRLGRPDAAQPRPARRGARADRAPQAPGVARPGVRVRCSPTTSCAGSCSPTTPGSAAGPVDTFEPHAQARMYRWVVERQQSKRTSLSALTPPVLRPSFTCRSSGSIPVVTSVPLGSRDASELTTRPLTHAPA